MKRLEMNSLHTSTRETLVTRIEWMVRQAHHERYQAIQKIAVRPEPVEGRKQCNARNKISKKLQIIKYLVCISSFAVAHHAAAQTATTFPAKPIRIFVSSAPGGLGDTVTRLVAHRMTDEIGQQLIVENRAGGGTVLATRAVKAATPDGYTLLATSNSITSVPAMRLNPGYDVIKDFAPVGQMVRSPWFLVVGGTQPDRTLADLIVRAKAAPGTLTFASSGAGTSPHLATEAMAKRAGMQMVHIPYKGNGAAMPDVISGRVTMLFEGPAAAMPKVKAGQFKVLGVTSATRLDAFADVPTLSEQGLAGFSAYAWIGLLAPATTPSAAVDKIAVAIKRATASKELAPRLLAEGMTAGVLSPQQFREALALELVETAKLVEALGLPKE